ncbi:hypothetical protein Scep_004526 [Stephania cephalantha]|uniref:Uncharacterized protein n=1 Tax=Stephania cephalantha TaxID=152367 RepID=A0AAP0KUD7_9MAGN
MLDLVIHLHRCCRRCYRVVIMFFINPELFFDYDWQPLFSDGYNKSIKVFDLHRPGRDFEQYSTIQGNKEGQSG